VAKTFDKSWVRSIVSEVNTNKHQHPFTFYDNDACTSRRLFSQAVDVFFPAHSLFSVRGISVTKNAKVNVTLVAIHIGAFSD
jgi:hypothetical protein